MTRFLPHARLSDVGEPKLLAAIAERLGHKGRRSPFGVGDDGALLRLLGRTAVVTHDLMVEHVDFRLSWSAWADVGAKAAMVNLSDLAAMGASPRGLLLGIAAPRRARAADLLSLVAACDQVGRRFGAPVIGGDLSAIDGPLVVGVTAAGEAGRHSLLRHRAAVGDVLCVTGRVGAAAAGLALLERPRRFAGLARAHVRTLMAAQRRPEAPVPLGAALARGGTASSATDVSDGIASDVCHLVDGGLGVVIEPGRLPVDAATRAAARCVTSSEAAARRQWQRWALSGGEDFSLLLSVPPARLPRLRALCNRVHAAITPIGRFVAGKGVTLWPPVAGTCPHAGFGHFARSPQTAAMSSGMAANKSATRP